jgi:hypothetical protein
VELIGIVALALLGVLGTAMSRQLTDEFKAWMPRIIERLIHSAVAKLPEDQRGRFEEEWRSHISETPGEIGKICNALSLLSAPRKMSKSLMTPEPFVERMGQFLAPVQPIIPKGDGAPTNIPEVTCGSCGVAIEEARDIVPEQRRRCPHCGSTARRYTVSVCLRMPIAIGSTDPREHARIRSVS